MLPLIYYAFRIMADIGFALFVLMLWTCCAALTGRLRTGTIGGQRLLLRAWMAAIPLGYIAVDTDWTVREVGRQPWIMYRLLRTNDAVSNLPIASVSFTTAGFFLIDSQLLAIFVFFADRIVRSGPDLSLPAPTIRSIIENYDSARFCFRRTVYPKATSNAQKSPFYPVFMASTNYISLQRRFNPSSGQQHYVRA